MTMRSLRPGAVQDLLTLRTWLEQSGLPVDDLTEAHMAGFVVLCENDEPVGMVGLEAFGVIGLLRSLVVDEARRGAGFGRQVVAALEDRARQHGVRELWLLTIDADAWFADLGYAVATRDDAPDSIRQTPEFARLCPGDAILMRKALA